MNEIELKLLKEELILSQQMIHYSFAGFWPGMSDRSVNWLIERVRTLRKLITDIECDMLADTQHKINCN